MRIRFAQSVSVPGGPLYHRGEVIATDPFLLTEARAQQYVARGWADEVKEETMASPTRPPDTRAPERPHRDKMLERTPKKGS